MKVKLRRGFIFRGRRYRRGEHEFPDDTTLPQTAEVVEGERKAEAEARGREKAEAARARADEKKAEAEERKAEAGTRL